MSDSELLDRLERLIRAKADAGEWAGVKLIAWYSGPGAPDGYAMYAGDDEPEANEAPTLREAIEDALKLYAEELNIPLLPTSDQPNA